VIDSLTAIDSATTFDSVMVMDAGPLWTVDGALAI
jgi:hypothetical protein